MGRPHEHSSVDRNMHYYMQGSGFEPRSPHLFNVNSSHYNTLKEKKKK